MIKQLDLHFRFTIYKPHDLCQIFHLKTAFCEKFNQIIFLRHIVLWSSINDLPKISVCGFCLDLNSLCLITHTHIQYHCFTCGSGRKICLIFVIVLNMVPKHKTAISYEMHLKKEQTVKCYRKNKCIRLVERWCVCIQLYLQNHVAIFWGDLD